MLQIGQVVKTLAVGRNVTCLYGGHQAKEERQSLSVAPDVVVATPGRLLDHLTHERLDLSKIALVVLDEFDKILELGFEETMRQVMGFMPGTARRILTSATPMTNEVPAFVKMDGAALLDCRGVDGPAARMEKWMVGEEKGLKKTELLLKLLPFCDGKTMVFANTRETARHLAATLRRSGLKVASYHAELSQADREKAVAMFRNGSVAVLASTDLAARGLDIEGGVDNIIHYDVPLTEQIFVHRNGRTARVGAHGRIFVFQGEGESLPDFMPDFDDWQWGSARTAAASAAMPDVTTLHLMAGKKEKISRGDVLGFLLAHNKISPQLMWG